METDTMRTPTPLDEVEFLARSEHRLSVLSTLSGVDHTRAELHESTGVSQPTLGRILNDFEERGWVERHGQTASLTPFGRVLAEEFEGLLGTVGTMQRFREIATHLPLEQVPFDLREFGDTTVTLPTTEDALAHVRRGEEVLVDAGAVRLLSPTIHPPLLRSVLDRIRGREQRHEAVMTATALDAALANPEVVALTREFLSTEGVSVYRYDGSVPLPLGTADGRAFLLPLDDHGVPCALVESENESITSWVTETLDGYCERATRLTVDDLPE